MQDAPSFSRSLRLGWDSTVFAGNCRPADTIGIVGDFFPKRKTTLPLYAYRCTQCGHRFEKIQNFSSEPELVCPKCQGVLERPLTAPRLHFKGAGWYVNDYAAKSSAPVSESGSESGSASGSGDASESGKGAASSETKAPSSGSESTSSTSAAASAPSTTPGSSAPASTS